MTAEPSLDRSVNIRVTKAQLMAETSELEQSLAESPDNRKTELRFKLGKAKLLHRLIPFHISDFPPEILSLIFRLAAQYSGSPNETSSIA